MLALPIARRELLILARASWTWQTRITTSIVVFICGAGFALLYDRLGQIGVVQAMHLLGVGLSFVCLFTGVALTADSIALEKREGTLGLLFLTHLSPFEIVMGKLVAYATAGLYTVLCALPLLSMTMIFGGVRLADVLMYLASALNLLFFSAAAGLFGSAICRDKKKAQSLGTLIIVLLWLVLPLLAVALNRFGSPRWLVEMLTRLSVNLPGATNLGIGRLLPSNSTGWNFAWTHFLAWMLLGITVWLLPHRWQDRPPRKRRRLRELWKALSLGTPARRLQLRRKLLDRNAFMWLASRERLQTFGVWLVMISLMSILIFQTLAAGLQPEMLIGVAVAVSFVLQMMFSGAAGAQLLREHNEGTLELVLATSLSAQDILHGQFAAARRQYRAVFAFTFALLWMGIVWLAWQGMGRYLVGIIILAVYSGVFLLNFYGIGWVSMWSIVKAPDPARTGANAFFFIVMLPGMLFGLLVICASFLTWLFRLSLPFGAEVTVPLLFLLAIGNCIYWLRIARRESPLELRRFAFRRYTAQERPNLFIRFARLAARWASPKTA